jgi:formate dehydrogenase major subunit
MGDSAFATREFTICTCDICTAQGSKELFNTITDKIKEMKMDAFVTVKTIRLKVSHAGEGIYITLDGKQIEEPVLENFNRSFQQLILNSIK